MALTFTTGMTEIDDCDTVTDWAAYKITSGGGTPTAVLDTDVKKEGIGCVGCVPTAAKDCGLSFDYFNANGDTVLDLSASGSEVVGVWMMILSSAMIETFQNGGGYIIVNADDGLPSTSSTWAKWYVQGSDNFYEGWNYFQVDTRKTPSASNGGWVAGDLATIYQVGIGTLTVDSWKAEWFYVDRVAYGNPVYTLTGDSVLTADWADFLSHSSTEVNGLIEDINGAFQLSCGIQFGDNAQTETTTFVDATNQALNFKRYTYYESGTADALTYADYYKITAEGAAGDLTSVTLGSLVGADAGILGGVIKSLDPTNVPVIIDFDTDQAHIAVLNLYGIIWQDITGSFKIGDNSAYNVFSNQFVGCSQIEPVGDPEIRNCLFISTADADAALLWNESIDILNCNFIANTVGAGIEMPSDVGDPYDYSYLFFPGNTYDVLNSSGNPISISKSNGSNPTNSEGSGVTFTSAAVTVEVHVQTKDAVDIENAVVMLAAKDGTGPYPFEDVVTISNSGTTATVTHTDHAMINNDYVYINGGDNPENEGVFQITYIGSASYSYTMLSAPGDDPTGTIEATFVALWGLTDASGDVSDDRVYSDAQPVKGWARKSTGSPLYQEFPLDDTVSSADGLSMTAVMASDE